MSNYIDGYFEADADHAALEALVRNVEDDGIVGLKPGTIADLVYMPAAYLPEPDARAFVFGLSDGKDTNVATYLFDSLDYAPEANIDLPKKAADRFSLVASTIEKLFHAVNAERLILFLHDCNPPEIVTNVPIRDLKSTLLHDLRSEPCALYVIRR